MASVTKVYMTRVRLKTKNAGRKRKNLLQTRGTTPTRAAFFGEESGAHSASSAKSSAAPKSQK